MSVKEDAASVLYAIAEFEASPADSRRGRHSLNGDDLQQTLDRRNIVIDPDRISDAVALLEQHGYLQVHYYNGTAPFAFGLVELTAAGRHEYEESKERASRLRSSANSNVQSQAPAEIDAVEMPIKIFISHAAADTSLADELVQCLFSSLELADEQVRCTSVAGHKLPIGSDVAATLKNDLSSSAVVLGLLTPKAINSSWVLFELGAAWGSGKQLFPLLGLGLDFSKLPGPLGRHHAVKASDENGMTQLLQELQQLTKVSGRSQAKRQAAVRRFVEHERALSESLAGAPPSGTDKA